MPMAQPPGSETRAPPARARHWPPTSTEAPNLPPTSSGAGVLGPGLAGGRREVGDRGKGRGVGVGGLGGLLTTIWFGAGGKVVNKGAFIIGGAVAFGLLVAAFAMAAQFIGSLYVVMAILFVMGACNSGYMISIQSSLQMLVPDRMRGRVMGFYGMTWSIMPLGGMQAGALASIITTPFAIAVGGLAVSAFAIGPALLNRGVRNLGSQLQPLESAEAEVVPAPADD
mgnify:CR=1 FL=1